MTKSIEILAPGGSFASLKAAIDSGADAVYFGGNRFGARANAVNLSDDEIKEAVIYAHLRSVKLYVTVNTLVFDSELDDVFDFLKFCYEEGVDGVIVQDLGVVNMIRQHFPGFRLHASTQMTVHNLAGVLRAKELGFHRVVLSRELSFDEIKYISDNTDMELEVFVHGALCMSYSGQCLFSSFLGGRSGNRGACAQPCRLPYTLEDCSGCEISEKNKYLLSLKDLCLIDHMSKLSELGVVSLKIEGRMKSEAYVSAVCGIYNKYRDGSKVSDSDRRLLENIFSRGGFTEGYQRADYGRNMLCYDKNHDNIFDSATDDVVSKAKSFANIDKKIAVKAHFNLKADSFPEFSVSFGNLMFSARGESKAEPAQNAAITADRIEAQLSKLGGTVFEYSSLDIDLDDGLYISVKDINSIRRAAFESLERHILGEKRTADSAGLNIIKPNTKPVPSPMLTASVLNLEQARAAYDLGFEKIYVPYSVYMSDKEFFESEKDVFALKLPPILHDGKIPDIGRCNCESVCITNLSQLSMIPKDWAVHADYRMNIFNTLSVKELMKMGVKSFTLSPELTIAQARSVAKSIPAELVVYGRISLMTVRNCVVKSSKGKCGCDSDAVYYLKDRKNIRFPLITDKDSCTNVIYNSAPILMSDRMRELEPVGAAMHRFDFTTETPSEMEEIVALYEKGKKSDIFFTRGHYYNGV